MVRVAGFEPATFRFNRSGVTPGVGLCVLPRLSAVGSRALVGGLLDRLRTT